jgi:hypothetical protein
MTFSGFPHFPWRIFLLTCLAANSIAAADLKKTASDQYLDRLQGTWTMDGTLRGKPVHYVADGQRVLQGGFLKLHMFDKGAKPSYEADVFIGFDSKVNDYIVHWLDRFGAAGARVVARGERQDQKLTVIFPYAEGAFRDTFTWQPESKSWAVLLESQDEHGAWSNFANYTLVRRRAR